MRGGVGDSAGRGNEKHTRALPSLLPLSAPPSPAPGTGSCSGLVGAGCGRPWWWRRAPWWRAEVGPGGWCSETGGLESERGGPRGHSLLHSHGCSLRADFSLPTPPPLKESQPCTPPWPAPPPPSRAAVDAWPLWRRPSRRRGAGACGGGEKKGGFLRERQPGGWPRGLPALNLSSPVARPRPPAHPHAHLPALPTPATSSSVPSTSASWAPCSPSAPHRARPAWACATSRARSRWACARPRPTACPQPR